MARNEMEQIITNLNITNPHLLPKSMEIERLMRLKVPSGSLKKGEVCRSAIAVDIASRILQITISKDLLISQATVSKKLYNDTFATCKRLLKIDIPTNMTIDSLSVKYGNERINKYAKSLMCTYLKTIPENRIQHGLLAAAIFYTTAKHHQINLKLQRYLDDNDICSNDFEILVKDIEVARITDHLAHFQMDNDLTTSITTEFPVLSKLPPVTDNPPATHSSLATTPEIANYEMNASTKYRSTNSKRVAEYVSGKFAANLTEVDEPITRKRQFTERIFQMWMEAVRQEVLATNKV